MAILRLKMFILLGVLFAIIYAIVSMISYALGIANFYYFYLVLSLIILFIQYMIAPILVEWSMRVVYIKKEQFPQLYSIVEEQAKKAGIPMPRVGVAQVSIPNAFAFGRSLSDARICVTQGILRLLNEEELKAVIGHEISHLKNRDVLTIMLLSVIPMIMYRIAWHFMFYGRRRDERSSANIALLGLVAFLFYFISNLLVLYASRIREYFADLGSIALGNKPSSLASALYKLVYGSARMDKETLREVEGFKAFFLNDPSSSLREIHELSQIDLDKSGTISQEELAQLRNKKVVLSFADRLLEILSTHPNMLKRIKSLSTYRT